MSRDKQIEEKTCMDCIHYNVCCLWSTTDLDEDKSYKHCFGNFKTIDEFATNHGYRKSADLAEEILGEIEKAQQRCRRVPYGWAAFKEVIAELKKKYLKGEGE